MSSHPFKNVVRIPVRKTGNGRAPGLLSSVLPSAAIEQGDAWLPVLPCAGKSLAGCRLGSSSRRKRVAKRHGSLSRGLQMAALRDSARWMQDTADTGSRYRCLLRWRGRRVLAVCRALGYGQAASAGGGQEFFRALVRSDHGKTGRLATGKSTGAGPCPCGGHQGGQCGIDRCPGAEHARAGKPGPSDGRPAHRAGRA